MKRRYCAVQFNLAGNAVDYSTFDDEQIAETWARNHTDDKFSCTVYEAYTCTELVSHVTFKGVSE